MAHYIDADRLRAEIEKERKKALDSTKRGGLTISDIATADALAEVLLIIGQLKKEQMMKTAVEVPLYLDGDFLTVDYNFKELGYKDGDEVKLIIIRP